MPSVGLPTPKLFPVAPVVIVDDDIYSLQVSELHLAARGLTNLNTCQNAAEAWQLLTARDVAVLVLDLYMPGMSGEELLAEVVSAYPDIPVIITTARDDVATAVRCIRAGAFDYLVKPIDADRLLTTVRRALELRELRQENRLLKQRVLNPALKHPEAFAEILTQAPQMDALFQYVESVAVTAQPVLITGETGVGKELIARAIHRLSGRAGSLIAVNVAGLDDPTFADSLFGHTRGAFTGADRLRAGLIEQALNGTLFLDEIGDLAPQAQVKLLRLLQEREYYPLGADRPKATNARIIVATNRDLAALQAAGTFRADLFYRLRAHHIHVPPLRERRADVPLLLNAFLQQAAAELRQPVSVAPPELVARLANYDFPGNIRELRTLVFDAVSQRGAAELAFRHFRHLLPDCHAATPPGAPATDAAQALSFEKFLAAVPQLPTLQELEAFLIQEALTRTRGNRTLSAELLGTPRRTLQRRLRMM